MYTIKHVVEVADEKCIGCKKCDRICPTDAIVTVGKLARVDESRCTGCVRCLIECLDHGAISVKLLDAPRRARVEVREEDKPRVAEICQRARLAEDESICVCTGTTAAEVAAAILQGATTPEEIAHRTGVRNVCTIWCTVPILRLLEAADVKVERSSRDWRIYPEHAGMAVGIWNVSPEVADKYPEYRIKENQQKLESGPIGLPWVPAILGESK